MFAGGPEAVAGIELVPEAVGVAGARRRVAVVGGDVDDAVVGGGASDVRGHRRGHSRCRVLTPVDVYQQVVVPVFAGHGLETVVRVERRRAIERPGQRGEQRECVRFRGRLFVFRGDVRLGVRVSRFATANVVLFPPRARDERRGELDGDELRESFARDQDIELDVAVPVDDVVKNHALLKRAGGHLPVQPGEFDALALRLFVPGVDNLARRHEARRELLRIHHPRGVATQALGDLQVVVHRENTSRDDHVQVAGIVARRHPRVRRKVGGVLSVRVAPVAVEVPDGGFQGGYRAVRRGVHGARLFVLKSAAQTDSPYPDLTGASLTSPSPPRPVAPARPRRGRPRGRADLTRPFRFQTETPSPALRVLRGRTRRALGRAELDARGVVKISIAPFF